MNRETLHARAYAGAHDLQSMIELIKRRPLEWATDFPGCLDLQEMLAVPRLQAGTRLWLDARRRLVAFAILDVDIASANLALEVSSYWKEKGLERQMVAWAEGFVRQSNPPGVQPFLLEASARSDNPATIALLEELGFVRQPGETVHLERSLAVPIPKPELPGGFSIRPLDGEAEAAEWVRLHRASHGTENMTVEYTLAMMRTPNQDPAMDLVAVAPDGTLVAYCVCFIDVERNALTGRRDGYTDPIAAHPDFQRRGLSKALMLSGLALLRERGMDTVCLGTSSDNLGMLRAAASAGFHITRNVFWFGKPIG